MLNDTTQRGASRLAAHWSILHQDGQGQTPEHVRNSSRRRMITSAQWGGSWIGDPILERDVGVPPAREAHPEPNGPKFGWQHRAQMSLDEQRFAGIADGLPLWHGAQLPIDTTLVETVQHEKELQTTAVQFCREPDERQRIYLTLVGEAARLVVLAAEVGGSRMRQPSSFVGWPRRVPILCHPAWLRRWSSLLIQVLTRGWAVGSHFSWDTCLFFVESFHVVSGLDCQTPRSGSQRGSTQHDDLLPCRPAIRSETFFSSRTLAYRQQGRLAAELEVLMR